MKNVHFLALLTSMKGYCLKLLKFHVIYSFVSLHNSEHLTWLLALFLCDSCICRYKSVYRCLPAYTELNRVISNTLLAHKYAITVI